MPSTPNYACWIESPITARISPLLDNFNFRIYYTTDSFNSGVYQITWTTYMLLQMASVQMLVFLLLTCCQNDNSGMANAADGNWSSLTLESVRNILTRQEDTIIYSLLERAKFPFNSNTYDETYTADVRGFRGTLIDFIVRNTESTEALAGRYSSPEENPFFPQHLPKSLIPSYPFPQVLHPTSSFININKFIWKFYFEELLPLFAADGDDGNYAQTAATDTVCLQAISRRIHYGKFVAEAKFRESPDDYEPAIRSKDRETLIQLLTDTSVEEMVKKRVQKKATIFGQDVSLNTPDSNDTYKVDPSIVAMLYDRWIVPLTKLVQVEYLLHRLD